MRKLHLIVKLAFVCIFLTLSVKNISAQYLQSGAQPVAIDLSHPMGKLGLGTGSPTEKLHLIGNMLIEGSGFLKFAIGGNTYNNFTLRQNSADFVLTSNIYSPSSTTDLLTINNSSAIFLPTIFQLGKYTVGGSPKLQIIGSGQYQTLRLANTSDNYGFDIVNNGFNTSLDFVRHANNATGVTAMTIKRDNGYVGIGNSAPTVPLEVTGNVKATKFIGDGSGLTGTSQWTSISGAIYFGNAYSSVSGKVGIGEPNPTKNLVIKNTFAPTIRLSLLDDSDYNWDIEGGNTDYNYSDLVFKAGNNNTTEKVRFTANGNVGIGVSNPSEKLQVAGNIKATKFIGDGSGLTGVPWLFNGSNINTNSNVGIGVVDPTQKLEIAGNIKLTNYAYQEFNIGNTKGYIWGNHDYSGASGLFEDDLVFSANWQGVTSNTDNIAAQSTFLRNSAISVGRHGIRFFTSINASSAPTAKVIITPEGKLGIGAIDPQYKTHIKGNLAVEGDGGTGYSDVNLVNGTNRWHISGPRNGDVANNRLGIFYYSGSNPAADYFTIRADGNVGIGSSNPDAKLTVKGKIHAEEVIIDLAVPADYVFDKSYQLMKLADVEKFVTENKHLPGIPSGKTIIANGLNMGEMQNKLLEKVEELTLYTIEQDKKLKAQDAINQQLINEINELKKLIKK